ncbi:MAG: 30S ribosomal protein S6 [bacterium]|nr:30S ribosomal protein S6 [bacterium]
MKTYECTIVVDGQKQLEEFKTLMGEFSVTLSGEKPWGKRLFTYPINKKESGEYYTMKLTIDPSKLAAMRQKLDYSNIVIRSLIIDEENL